MNNLYNAINLYREGNIKENESKEAQKENENNMPCDLDNSKKYVILTI